MDRDVRLRWLIVAICGLVPSSASAAAPFVHGQPARLSVQIAESRAAVIARRVDAAGETPLWSIDTILNDATGSVKTGSQIRPQPAPPADFKLALIVSHADRRVSAVPLSQAALGYVKGLPRLHDPPEGRLSYVLDHLPSSDALVAADVFAELSALDGKSFEACRANLPADAFRKRINDPNTSGERLGLYGYLLGLCGEARDAGPLRERFLKAEPFAGGADGLAAGYLLLTGEQGLATLETDVFSSNEHSPLLAAALFETLRFFREGDAGPFSRDRLTQAACSGFRRPETADLAVGYLVAAREWSAMPRVIELLDMKDDNLDRKRAVQVVAVRFLLECRRDSDTTAAKRALAIKALSHVGTHDPDLLRRAMHLAGEMPAVR
jgi:hypothetical protein